MPKTVRFYTLGCKVNQYDSEAMLEAFLSRGYAPAPDGAPADVYVVNTCTVTGTGDQKSLQVARRFRRQNPGGELVLAGCLAQRLGEELRETGARLILGTQYRAQVVDLLEKALAEGTQLVAVESLRNAAFEPLLIRAHEGHTRAVMKIQEGCDNRCAYCVIPSVRGGVRSKPVDAVRAEAQALAAAGFSELVLTGVHLTSYGRDQESRPTLADAIRAVHGVEGVKRIRLGSLEPAAATEAFIDATAGLPKLCPQFHLSLQSGSDAVLARMRRRYNAGQFRQAALRLAAAFPDAAFTTDVIVGFPGETEEEFNETVAFCREIGFLKLHVFPFSPREGTAAASMEEQVPESVKAERVGRLIAVGKELSVRYRERLLGAVQPVLLEQRGADGTWQGYTPQYVHVSCGGGASGKIVNVKLTALTEAGMAGEPVETLE
jgi:threonylcarbamoyladenosine tRNA methylthiotransferase MtaB